MVEVYIDNTLVNINKSLVIKLTKQYKDINEVLKSKKSYTRTIEVIQDNTSNKLFKNAYNIGVVDKFDKDIRLDARIEVDGFAVITGRCLLSTITDTYNVIIYENALDFANTFEDQLIYGNSDSALDLYIPNDDTVTMNRDLLRDDYLQSLFTTTGIRADDLGEKLIFPYVNYHHTEMDCSNDDYATSRNSLFDIGRDYPMLPAVPVTKLFTKLMYDNGFGVTYTAAVSDIMNQMYIPFNGDVTDLINHNDMITTYSAPLSVELPPTETDLYLHRFSGMSYVSDFIREVPTGTLVDSSIDLIGEGKYLITINLTAKIGSGHDSTATLHLVARARNTITNEYISIPIYVNGGYVYDDGYQTYHEYTINDTTYNTQECNFLVNTSGYTDLWLGFDGFDDEFFDPYYDPFTGATQYQTIDIDSSSSITVQKVDSIYGNTVISINDALPRNYKKADFILDVMNTLNLNLSVDYETSTVLIESFNEYIQDHYIETAWADKVDKGSVELSYLTDVTGGGAIKSISFEKGDDLLTKEIESYNTPWEYTNEDGSVDISLTYPYTPCIDNHKADVAGDVQHIMKTACIIKEEYPNNINPARLLFVNMSHIGTTYGNPLGGFNYGLDIESGKDVRVEYFLTLTDQFQDLIGNGVYWNMFNLSLNNETDKKPVSVNYEITNNDGDYYTSTYSLNLYTKFNKQEETFNSSKEIYFLEADIDLTSKLVANSNFTDKIFLELGRHGADYFRLNAITDHSIGQNKLSKVELYQTKFDLQEEFEDSPRSSIVEVGVFKPSTSMQETQNSNYSYIY